MMLNRSKILPFAFLLLTLATAVASAQSTTATLSGTVVDANGAAIPGANVTLSNTATGFERKVTTNAEGSFTIPLLPPSNYTLTVGRDGFAPAEIQNVILNVNDQKSILIQLKVGQVGAEVEVTTEASLAAFATSNPCEVVVTPTTPGQPERILVRAILLSKNEPVGEPSDPTFVTVNP